MPKLFHLTILSSDKKIFEGDLQSLVAPGEIGYLGILADHAPLMTTLLPGKITLKDASGKTTALDSKTNGFLEIIKNRATILLDQEHRT
ncbi:MAG: F0F1 ATP synthase subunit epsilon [Candidatus Omnitrophica bacterium]|nr:F0F1 ATP synthase subunit epsilon [Candidatus Omnitrophota bacterium]